MSHGGIHMSLKATWRLTASAVLFFAGIVFALSGTAGAASKPTVSLAFTSNKIEHTSPAKFQYSSKRLSKTAVLSLQTQEGTKRVWRTVKKLKGLSGSAVAPRVPQGRFEYRVIATGKKAGRATLLAASGAKTLYSYAPVSLLRLCNTDLTFNAGGWCQGGTEQVGATVYAYAALLYANQYPQWDDSLDSTANTTCRSAHLTFAQNDDGAGGSQGFATYVRVVQETVDAVSASAPPNTIGALAVHLDGRPWHMDAASSTTGGVYVNGSFDCWSASGF